MQTRSARLAFLFPLLISLGGIGVARADITLSNSPLFLSTSVTPNVMLLVDNSGSMNNIIWDSDYDPSTTYPSYATNTCGQNNNQTCWSSDQGNVILYNDNKTSSSSCQFGTANRTSANCNNLPAPSSAGVGPEKGGCADNYREGKLKGTGTKRCLRLPDPVGGGNTRYTGNYLNYLFHTKVANNDSVDLRTSIPTTYRIEVARNVATDLVTANPALRFGLSSFNAPTGSGNNYNGAPGGSINAECGAAQNTLLTAIGNLGATSNTPLAETYYEITRYFRGLSRYQGSGSGNYVSPIQYRCQKNFVIAITDGFPTYDNNFPNNDPDVTAFNALPNWDGLNPATQSSTYPFFPAFSDGFRNESGSTEADEGYTLYLDDLAKFGYDIDLKKTGNDLTNISYNDVSFPTQRLQTYTVGLAINNQMLQDAAANGNGKAYTANNAAQLQSALQNALNDIASRTSAAASVATNSTRLTANSAIYQARFSTSDWSGQLRALRVKLDGSVEEPPLWDAAQHIPAAGSRNILTYDPTAAVDSRGKTFAWASLNNTQKADLNKNAAGTADGNGEARLNYLRGVRTNEGDAASNFRRRNAASVLGDIVNSDPAFAGQQDYGFAALPGAEGSSYTSFRTSAAYTSRPPMLYVGANDGMLHGFRASDGVELLAFVPNAVYGKLSQLPDRNYNQNHLYFVDGAVRTLDARVNGTWKTVILGTLGGGGKSVFALDVTTPTSFGAGNVMWEFTNTTNMGYSYPQATIARMANGKWAAIIGNGYNSPSGKAVLYLVDLDDGSVIKEFDTGVSGDNGMSSPIPVDVNGDRIADLIYAGDLKGNLWKIDVRDANAANWDFALKSGSTPQPLYTACTTASCTTNNRQAITARPEVGTHPDGGYIVYFGTGSYFTSDDNTAGSIGNTFYGIYDKDNGTRASGRGELQQQTVLATVTKDFGTQKENVRVTSDTEPSSDRKGWYLDLPASGERQVSTPILRGDAIIFTTLIPNTDACGFGGDSFLMEVHAVGGSRMPSPPFDLNRDGEFDNGDKVRLTEDGPLLVVSGRQSKEGIIKTPAIIAAGAFEVKLASGTTGGIDTTIEPPQGIVPGGRMSWRQVQ